MTFLQISLPTLLDTWPNELEEGNNWGDMYWGKVNGFGENKLELGV